MSIPETILNALQQCLLNVAPCLRNAALPERVGSVGLIIIRDGTPTLHDAPLGGLGESYYSHEIEIEVYVQEMDGAKRDQMFDVLLMHIGHVFEADPTLNNAVFGLTYSRPSVEVEPIEGAPAIKHGLLMLTVEYTAPSPLQ